MFKKIFISLLLCISIIYATGTGTVNMNVNSSQWNLTAPNDNSIHVIYLPADLDLSTLQSSLANGQTLIIYNLVAYPDWMKQFTNNIPFVAAIKVTNSSISYLTLVNGIQKTFTDYNAFKAYVDGQNFTQTSGFSLSDYLSYFTKLKAGGLYYIKSIGTDLTFDINFGGSSSGSSQSSSSSNSSSSSSSENHYHITDISGVHLSIDFNTSSEVDDLYFCPNHNYKIHGIDENGEYTDYGTWSISDGKIVINDPDGTSTITLYDQPLVHTAGSFISQDDNGTFSITSVVTGITNDECIQSSSSSANSSSSSSSSAGASGGSSSSSALAMPPTPGGGGSGLDTPPTP